MIKCQTTIHFGASDYSATIKRGAETITLDLSKCRGKDFKQLGTVICELHGITGPTVVEPRKPRRVVAKAKAAPDKPAKRKTRRIDVGVEEVRA